MNRPTLSRDPCRSMKRQWIFYIVIGVLFGVLNFYLVMARSTFWLFAVWFVPLIPITLYQAKATRSKRSSALAGSLTWCTAVIVYYLTNIGQWALGSSSQPFLRVSNDQSSYFWSNWKSVLASYILGHVIEWGIIAIVGGSAVGFIVASLYLLFSRNNSVSDPG